MWADRVWKQLYVLLSDKLHKLSYRNLQLSVVLPEKKKHEQTQAVFVKRVYGTFGEPCSVFIETGELLPGIRSHATQFHAPLVKTCVWQVGPGQQ